MHVTKYLSRTLTLPSAEDGIGKREKGHEWGSGGGGFGLGLAIGRELARRMGGELRLDDATQTGARFVLQLPIELPSGSHPEAETAQTAT